MKKLVLVLFIFPLIFQISFGQSKVAVLDASLGGGVHPNAAAIVADTINEQFVKSPDFIAIDRAYISSIQEEKKFQLSGDVNTDDIKELGITFGAEFLCIANVSQLGSTYTVSARLIEVETAQVVSQESARMQGQIDVLFNIAEEVGSKLIGRDIDQSSPDQTTTQEKPVEPEPTTVLQKQQSKSKTFSRTTVSYMMPSYLGSGYDYLESILINYMNSSGYDSWTMGLDIHSLLSIGQFYYISLSGSFGAEYITSYISDGYFQYDTDYMSFSNIDFRISVGGLYPIGGFIQFYGGLGLGYQYVVISDEAWNISTFNES
ncbi:MAG: porin family protein, partial [Spirochaetales bacterium]|nr:porin family protein [Spirochaetales bacterium]